MEARTESPHPVKRMLCASRDWSALPLDILLLVFRKLGPVEILMGSGLVCHSWLETAMVPDLWRSVDMANHNVEKVGEHVLCAVAKVAVDRSKGRLEVFLGKLFVTDEILKYIGDRYYLISVLDLIYLRVDLILWCFFSHFFPFGRSRL